MQGCDLNELEIEILQHLADGLNRREITLKLGINYSHLANDLESIKNILQADSVVHAVAIALRREYID